MSTYCIYVLLNYVFQLFGLSAQMNSAKPKDPIIKIEI